MASESNRIHLRLDKHAAQSIDDYLEYKRIVGDDDGGVLFTPDQYEEYKRNVVPKRMKNRLFVSWASKASGIECKMIGPETKCFCQHRYKQHQTDFDTIPDSRPIHLPCKTIGCGCKTFYYVPTNGSRPIRCTCKHFTDEHSVVGAKKCKKSGCTCKKFHSSYTCGCGEATYNHQMIVETKTERESRGRPVGHATAYQAMGGLTGFSSLADGYMRLDDSGIGTPSREILEQQSGPFDHPFLKVHDDLQQLCLQDNTQQSHMTQEEKDMAYFEKRYQERLKAERSTARLRNNPKLQNATQSAIPKKTGRTERR